MTERAPGRAGGGRTVWFRRPRRSRIATARRVCRATTGRLLFGGSFPRAAPWAAMGRPFGASEAPRPGSGQADVASASAWVGGPSRGARSVGPKGRRGLSEGRRPGAARRGSRRPVRGGRTVARGALRRPEGPSRSQRRRKAWGGAARFPAPCRGGRAVARGALRRPEGPSRSQRRRKAWGGAARFPAPCRGAIIDAQAHRSPGELGRPRAAVLSTPCPLLSQGKGGGPCAGAGSPGHKRR
jgi:hypothetical protein